MMSDHCLKTILSVSLIVIYSVVAVLVRDVVPIATHVVIRWQLMCLIGQNQHFFFLLVSHPTAKSGEFKDTINDPASFDSVLYYCNTRLPIGIYSYI